MNLKEKVTICSLTFVKQTPACSRSAAHADRVLPSLDSIVMANANGVNLGEGGVYTGADPHLVEFVEYLFNETLF